MPTMALQRRGGRKLTELTSCSGGQTQKRKDPPRAPAVRCGQRPWAEKEPSRRPSEKLRARHTEAERWRVDLRGRAAARARSIGVQER